MEHIFEEEAEDHYEDEVTREEIESADEENLNTTLLEGLSGFLDGMDDDSAIELLEEAGF